MDIDETRYDDAEERLTRLRTVTVYDIDPDDLPPDNSSSMSDWGSELQMEAARYGVPEPVYLPVLGRPGFIRKGFVHLLTAAPKAGKTELLLQSIADWDHHAEVVYYFTEEYRDLWLERLDGMRQRGYTYEHVKFFYLPRLEPAKRMDFITGRIGDDMPTVIIVDTIRSGLPIEDEANNPAIRKVLEPITTQAHAAEKTVILVHHTSKAMASKSKLISSAGGLDFLGAVDAVLNLTPKGPNTDTRRVLIGNGRMRFGGDLTYHWPDKAGPLRVLDEEEDLVVPDTLTFDWQSTRKIGVPLELLKQMATEGLIECNLDLNKENQGKTYLWRRSDELE